MRIYNGFTKKKIKEIREHMANNTDTVLTISKDQLKGQKPVLSSRVQGAVLEMSNNTYMCSGVEENGKLIALKTMKND